MIKRDRLAKKKKHLYVANFTNNFVYHIKYIHTQTKLAVFVVFLIVAAVSTVNQTLIEKVLFSKQTKELINIQGTSSYCDNMLNG